jgi:hypothetical protein
MSLLSLLVTILAFAVVFWAARRLLAAFSIGEPIATVIYVLLVILFLAYLLSAIGVLPGMRIT